MLGLPGVGKSWVVDSLAVHIAGGKPFLGYNVTGGPVLLIDEDTPSDELSSRLARLTSSYPDLNLNDLPLKVISMEGRDLSNEKSLKELKREADGASLVILDCLSKIMGASFNENSAKDANAAGTVCSQLKASGATVILVHHLNKRDGNLATDIVKLSRGSGALVANCDTAFGIELGRTIPLQFNIYPYPKRRKLKVRKPFGIEIAEDFGMEYARLKRVDIAYQVSELAKDIYPLFSENNTRLSVHDVTKKLKGEGEAWQVRNALHELNRAGFIEKGVERSNRYTYAKKKGLS